ncbi:MFS general substrate transporter [Lenzites betulinus]|nr:MFS general substrate transporter [Lenzites betulinus]
MSTSQLGLADAKREGGSAAPSVHKSEATVIVESSRPQTAKNDDATAQNTLAVDVIPDGGMAAWTTVAGAFLCQMCGFGYTGAFGVYQDYYTRVYLSNDSSSAVSWIGSLNAFIMISSGLIAGRLYDRGYFYHLLYGGSILLSFSLFMHSLAKPQQYYQIILSQGIGAGLGGGMTYIPSVAVLSQYFTKRRALAMTIVASGSSLGSIIHPIMLNNTLNNPRIGFAIAARANAGLISGLMLIACLLMRTRTGRVQTPPPLWASAKRFAKDGSYVFAVLGMSIFGIGFYFPLFYIQLDALAHGLNDTFSFYSLVILNSFSFIGRLAPGFFANRLGVHNIIVVSTFCCAVMIFAMIGLKSVASVIVIAIIYGLSAGTYIAMIAPLLASLTDDMSELGARMGIAFALYGVGSLIGTPISGALLTDRFIWWRPAVFSGIMGLAAFACLCVSIILLRRRKAKLRREVEKA